MSKKKLLKTIGRLESDVAALKERVSKLEAETDEPISIMDAYEIYPQKFPRESTVIYPPETYTT